MFGLNKFPVNPVNQQLATLIGLSWRLEEPRSKRTTLSLLLPTK
jgi:hypothetical protein